MTTYKCLPITCILSNIQYYSIMNVSSEPLRGAVLGQKTSKYCVTTPQLGILPSQRQLFGALSRPVKFHRLARFPFVKLYLNRKIHITLYRKQRLQRWRSSFSVRLSYRRSAVWNPVATDLFRHVQLSNA